MMAETLPPPVDAMHRVNAVLQSGDYRSAHEQLVILVAAHPGCAEALRLLAGTKQALGDVTAAETMLRRALALDPLWVPTLVTLAELLLASGRCEEAEALLKRAVTGKCPYPRAVLLLTRYYNDLRRPADALAVAAPLCLNGRADGPLAEQHVAALVALGRQDEAVAGYRRLASAAPDNPAMAQALAMALESADQRQEAERVAQGALAGGHRSAAIYNTYAKSLIAQDQFERAEAALHDAVRLDPRLVESQSNLAQLIWMRTGDLAQATTPLDQALQVHSHDDALWATKAAILQGAGDVRAAYACLAAQAARAHSSPALLVRAGLAALEFDPATAVRLAERALHALPSNTAARTLLAAAQLSVGDARAALPECETLCAAAPDDQYLLALLTTAWRLLGDERYAQLCDYQRLVLSAQLEAPKRWPNMASFFADLKVSLKHLHNPHGFPLLFQSLRRGTETTRDLTRSSDLAIRALFESFTAPINRYLEHIGRGTDPLRRRNQGRWRFNGSWSVRLHDTGYHTNHVHPRGWVSSACYLELPDCMNDERNQEGALTFGEPSFKTTPVLSPEYSVHPRVGMLVLFPSYVWHGTVPFSSNQTRLTVAFDVVPDR